MASVSAIGFYAASAVALLAASVAMSTRTPTRALAGFALALAAVVVPLIQLGAPTVAAVTLLAAGVAVALLAGVARLAPAGPQPARTSKFWLPACVGLAGFVWALLATGSRQVAEPLPPLERGAVGYGEGARVLEQLSAAHLVSTTVVGLIALCCVTDSISAAAPRPG